MEEKLEQPDITKPYSWSPMNIAARHYYNINRFGKGLYDKHKKTNQEIRQIINEFNDKFEVRTPDAVWGFMTDKEIDLLIENPVPAFKPHNIHETYIVPNKPIEIIWKDKPDFPEYYIPYIQQFIESFESYGCVKKAYWNSLTGERDDNYMWIIRDTDFMDRGYNCCKSCYLESAIHKKSSKQINIQALGYARCYIKAEGNAARDKFISRAKKKKYQFESWEFDRIGDGTWRAEIFRI